LADPDADVGGRTAAPEQGALGSTLLYELRDGVARITLNRPDAASALSVDQRDLMIRLLNQADGDPDVRAVVIGANGRHFCSGADVKAVAGAMGPHRLAGSTMRMMLSGAQKLISAILDCGKPVVAAVQGPALGLGAQLAFACDLLVATDTAYFMEPFVLRGIAVDAGGAYLLPRSIGLQKAKELVFLGERLSATEAKSMGLVNWVYSEADFPGAVDALAARLAAAATTSIALGKRLINASLDGDRAAAFLAEAMAQEIATTSEDASEGVSAFLEKRFPKFRGR